MLKDVIAYILKEYPNKGHLSKARLNKLIYLVDWKSAIDNRKQVTNIKWIYNHYGPYVTDIEKLIRENPDIFKIEKIENFYGNEKNIIKLVDKPKGVNEISKETKEIIHKVFESTKNMNWTTFIDSVYATYPVKNSEKMSEMDLVKFAKEYKPNTV